MCIVALLRPREEVNYIIIFYLCCDARLYTYKVSNAKCICFSLICFTTGKGTVMTVIFKTNNKTHKNSHSRYLFQLFQMS